MSFTKFTIYGERCTGTNFLRKLIHDNFNLENEYLPNVTFGWKHWFGTENNKTAIRESKNCVILSIVRNPIDTLMSFFEHPHHQPKERTYDLEAFLMDEFYSVNHKKEELMLDRHFEDGWRRFKNIFEMRAVKNRFLFHKIPVLTQNSYFMQYENLKTNPSKILLELESKFCLERKQSEFIIENRRINPQSIDWNIFHYSEVPLKENYVVQDIRASYLIKENLDFKTEEDIGYDKKSIIDRLM